MWNIQIYFALATNECHGSIELVLAVQRKIVDPAEFFPSSSPISQGAPCLQNPSGEEYCGDAQRNLAPEGSVGRVAQAAGLGEAPNRTPAAKYLENEPHSEYLEEAHR